LGLPTVNIGIRQQGRERAGNVLDAAANVAEIVAAIGAVRRAEFRAALRGLRNPYGDGMASERIVEVLKSVELGPKLLMKKGTPLATVSSS
jgi:UDP-N-acetylglucosamine 2-epimerase